MHGWDEYDSQARWYYPAIMRTTTTDPLAEKYYDISPYAWCGNNPVKFVDPDGRWVWAAVGASIDYGFQVYDNYQNGSTGYDAWVGKVNFVNVGLSAVNPAGKFKVLKTLAVELSKATVGYSPNEGVNVETDVKKVATQTVINTVVNIGTNKVTKASSDKAVQNTNKEAASANKQLKTAERQAQRSPNSTKKAENLNAAQSNVQATRNKQVRTQMLNSTVGKVPPNAVNATTNAATNRILRDEEKK